MTGELSDRDRELLALAVDLATRCPPSERAFAVGAVIATPAGEVLATGHSRERDPRSHAEEEAIGKATARGIDLSGTHMFVTMEPCGERKSSPLCCADRIVAAGTARVVYLLAEPPHFVTPAGAAKLRATGIATVHAGPLAPALEARARALNRHGFPENGGSAP